MISALHSLDSYNLWYRRLKQCVAIWPLGEKALVVPGGCSAAGEMQAGVQKCEHLARVEWTCQVKQGVSSVWTVVASAPVSDPTLLGGFQRSLQPSEKCDLPPSVRLPWDPCYLWPAMCSSIAYIPKSASACARYVSLGMASLCPRQKHGEHVITLKTFTENNHSTSHSCTTID